MFVYRTDKEIMQEFPPDDSEMKAKYECPCGEVWEVSRYLLSGRGGLGIGPGRDLSQIKCHRCGRHMHEWRLVKQNYEKRLDALDESEQALRESWVPWKPKDLLEYIHKYSRKKDDTTE
jgi:hypothetical protein